MQGFCSGAARLVDKIGGSLQLFFIRCINPMNSQYIFDGRLLNAEDFFRAITPFADLEKDNAVGIFLNDFLQFVFQLNKCRRSQFALEHRILNPV